jgi:hypothetical protein
LYLPAAPHDRAPAVLLYPGHSWNAEGKSHHDAQVFAATMARMGFVVFVFDPIGQGERGPLRRRLPNRANVARRSLPARRRGIRNPLCA